MSEQIRGQEELPLFYLAIPDLQTLGALYMPYIRNGGLFIPTSKTYGIGKQVFLIFRLMNEPSRWPVCAKVIWLTPDKAQGKKLRGIGVRFMDRDNCLKGKMDKLLLNHNAEKIKSATID